MSKYSGKERRKHARLPINFVISYKMVDSDISADLSQTKDVSQGGMLLTTNTRFESGTQLVMTIRFPFITKKIEVVAEVVDSKTVVKNLIYNTRIKFYGLAEALYEELGNFINKRLHNE